MLPFDAKKLQEPPKFVHRLSTEITGILLLARHKAAAAYAKALQLFLSSTGKKDVITLNVRVFLIQSNNEDFWGRHYRRWFLFWCLS